MNTRTVLLQYWAQVDESDGAVRRSMGWFSLFLLIVAGGFFVSRHLSTTLVLVGLVVVLSLVAMFRPLALASLHKACSTLVYLISLWLTASGRWLVHRLALPVWRKISRLLSRKSTPPDASV